MPLQFDNLLEKAPKIIAIGAPFLILFGVISNVVYYGAFSINILDYIALSEVLILFISNFSVLMVCIIAGFGIGELHSSPIPKVNDTSEETVKEIESKPKHKEKVGKSIFKRILITGLFSLSFIEFNSISISAIVLSAAIRLLVLILILNLLDSYYKVRSRPSLDLRLFYSIGFLLISTLTVPMFNAYTVYNNLSKKEVSLYITGSIIMKSDASLLFIGKSNSYYFWFNKKESKAIVLKSDQFDRVEITNH